MKSQDYRSNLSNPPPILSTSLGISGSFPLMANSISCHVVAIPYPGRGHVNPMMNLCKLIALRRPSDFRITFVLTEEWLGFIASEPKPDNIRFATIPNVIPSEVNRAADFAGFFKATLTKLEDPVEQLLHQMEVPASVLIYDTYLKWVVSLGSRMNIPVASLFTMSATVFSMSYHYDLLVQNGHIGDNFSEKAEEKVDYVPGVPPIRVADLVTGFNGKGKQVMPAALESILMASKAQLLLFVSVYELEAQVIDALKSILSIPVYAIGPAIPYFNLKPNFGNDKNYPDNFLPNLNHAKNGQNTLNLERSLDSGNEQNTIVSSGSNRNYVENDQNVLDYIKWLDHQPKASVIYISQGSFLSVSNAQLEEIINGIHDSGVRYMWVARGELSRFKHGNNENGLVVPWCDQLRVLCHSSIGAFWSHCGWNSTKEGAFSGVPMLTFPIFWDQVPNSKMIVEDWKIGKRVMKKEGTLVTRHEITRLVKSFMEAESEEDKEIRENARQIKQICQQAITEQGSAQLDLDSFIRDISKNFRS